MNARREGWAPRESHACDWRRWCVPPKHGLRFPSILQLASKYTTLATTIKCGYLGVLCLRVRMSLRWDTSWNSPLLDEKKSWFNWVAPQSFFLTDKGALIKDNFSLFTLLHRFLPSALSATSLDFFSFPMVPLPPLFPFFSRLTVCSLSLPCVHPSLCPSNLFSLCAVCEMLN